MYFLIDQRHVIPSYKDCCSTLPSLFCGHMYFFKALTFAKIPRKGGLLKTLDRCCSGNGLSLHHTRWVLTRNLCCSGIYNATLFRFYVPLFICLINCTVLIMTVFCSSCSTKMLNARQSAQNHIRKAARRIQQNLIFLRWGCSSIISTTG